MKTTPNARFWAFINGCPVKITLKPGQILSHCSGGRCEEGHAFHSETWEHVGHAVESSWSRWGSDCDGRYSDGGQGFAPLDQLDTHDGYADAEDQRPPELVGILFPSWEVADRFQRDYAAEAAGY